MSVIWIIEKQKPEAAFKALMGDFAVRVFASLASFEQLVKLNRRQLPQLVVIDVEDTAVSEAKITALMETVLTQVPILLLHAADKETQTSGLPERCLRVSKPFDGLSFSVLANFVMRSLARQGGVVRYRDVMLDYERFQCMVVPGEESVSLPLKEAQLLKLFLEQPGVCLSRESIQTALWSGVRITPRTIDSHISRLRKRLKDAEVSIESVYGGGYVLR